MPPFPYSAPEITNFLWREVPALLARFDPVRFEHLNRLGKYAFQRATKVQSNGFRPLRNPSQSPGPEA